MQDCVIIFKEKEYTPEEFKNFILKEGIGGVFEGSTEVPTDMKKKYDFLDEEDSLMEMWAKLEADKLGIEYLGTKEQIQSLLQPKGQLTDFATQEQIRYNTYSGISLTGISANFGKTLGNLFETTPISSVYDNDTGEIIHDRSEQHLKLRDVYNIESLDELVTASTRFKVQSRYPVMINQKNMFQVDGFLVDRFRREEIKLSRKQKVANIFETVDTIINLAIDNVKEQKLHILGITDASANSFMNMIGLGVPFHVVSKIFKSPSVVKLASKGRYGEPSIRGVLMEPALEVLGKYSTTEIQSAIEQYGINIKSRPSMGDTFRFTGNHVSTELLDKVYTGKATELEIAVNNFLLGEVMLKTLDLNEMMFDYAQILGVLRQFPNKKWKIDSLVRKIEKYSALKEEEGRAANSIKDYEEAVKKNFKDTSPAYKLLVEEGRIEEADKLLADELENVRQSPAFQGELYRALEAGTVAALIRRGRSITATSGDKAAVANSTPLRLPHVYEAYISLLQLKSIIERLFTVESSTVSKFIMNVLDNASVFSAFDSAEKTDAAKRDLIKYLSSGLQFKIWGKDVDLAVDPQTSYYVGGYTITGQEAWTQEFIDKIKALEPDTDNMFLSSIEPDIIRGTTLKTLRILSDKVSDEELLERIREDFVTFAKANPELALDLFKFNLISNAMYYDKTGFSLIFPDSWAASFSQALSDRLNTVIPTAKTLTQFNLEVLRDDFLFQFLRNNSELISFPRNTKSDATSYFQKYTKGKGSRKKTPFYGGVSPRDGNHFDLRLTASGRPQKFVRQYGSDVFMHVESDNNYDYYVKITEGAGHRSYSFSPHKLEESLSFKKLENLFTGQRVVNSSRILNDKYRSEHLADELEVGQIIAAYDKSATHLTTAHRYRVTKVVGTEEINAIKSNVYEVKYIDTVDLTKKEEARTLRTKLSMFVDQQLGTINTIKDIMEVKNLVTTDNNNVLVTNLPVDGVPHTALTIPRWEERPSAEEIDKALKTLFKEISALDKTKNYFFTSDLLTPLDRFESVKRKVASYLYRKLGYTVPSVEVEKDEVVSKEMIVVKNALLRQELGIIGLKKKKLTQTEGETTHTASLDGLGKEARSSIREGSVIFLGSKDSDSMYGIVREVSEKDNTVQVTIFDQDFFLNNVNSASYDVNEFDTLYNQYLKEKC